MASLMEHIQFYSTVSYVPRKILECASSLRRAVPYEAWTPQKNLTSATVML